MDAKAMETEIKELKNQVAALNSRLTKLQDLEDIQRLQKSYGYYLEHWMYEDIIDLFADDLDTTLNIMAGIYLGKEGVRRYFTGASRIAKTPEFLHQIMQLSGVVDISPDGKTAEGRFYGFGSVALPMGEGVRQMFTDGIYTSKYIKKDGIWRILSLMWNPLYTAAPDKGWVAPERLAAATPSRPQGTFSNTHQPDKPRDVDARYPSGYIVPFHYKHPVTGKPSTDAQRNSLLHKKD
jgi:hypothetical protein